MSCVYGPVPSRRLGSSLGLDVIPPYTCTFDCIYCQLERTAQKVSGINELDRDDFPTTSEVVSEVREALGKYEDIDYIAFSGSGEPTLNPNLGTIVSQLRKVTDLPVALITNSSLLTEKVHPNTPVRPPVEEVKPLSSLEMRRARRDLQRDLPSNIDIEIIAERSQSSSQLLDDRKAADEIRKLLKIRPCTSTDIADSIGLNVNEVSKQLERLLEKGELKRQRREDQVYYRLKED